MAARLLDAGYPLGVYDRKRETTRPLEERGSRVYDSPRALARESDVVLSSVADDAAVEQVLLGPEGAMEGARPGSVLIDLSSVHPDTVRRVWAEGRQRGVAVLDAPVSGSTQQAAEGTLIMYVGGDRETYDRVRPILDVLGRSIFYMGPSGAGDTMKLVVNSILGAELQAIAEAIALGERAGLPRDVLLATLAETTVIAPAHKAKLENARTGEYPVTFALRLMYKDFGNVMRLAHQHTVPMPATAVASEMAAVEQVKGIEEDYSAVIRAMEELAGIPPAATPAGRTAAQPAATASPRG
jgi:3-hydroxyisobutyrate dehydrogenase-like beta-hydroxyacid dehydrogenase